jgi:allantoinase
MDHSLYPYSALPQRPASPLPAGLQCYVLLCLEHWHALPPEGALKDPRFVGEFGSFSPDYRSWTQREYGLRIGLFRVLDALDAAGLRPAVAINGALLERMPELVENLARRGCQWLGHGWAANALMHTRMSVQAQREHIAKCLQAFERYLGQAPLGWLSQDWGTTPDTPALLGEAGIDHTLDWINDDQAYLMHTHTPGQPPLVAVPLSAEWDDVQCQWLRNLSPRAHAQLVLRAFDQLRSECAGANRQAVFGLALHPWVCGMSSRIGALRWLLGELTARRDVCWTTPGEIALHARHAGISIQP